MITRQIFEVLPPYVKNVLSKEKMLELVGAIEFAQMLLEDEKDSETLNNTNISNVSDEIIEYKSFDTSPEVKVRALRRREIYKKSNVYSKKIPKVNKEKQKKEKASKKVAELKSIKKQMKQLEAEYCN